MSWTGLWPTGTRQCSHTVRDSGTLLSVSVADVRACETGLATSVFFMVFARVGGSIMFQCSRMGRGIGCCKTTTTQQAQYVNIALCASQDMPLTLVLLAVRKACCGARRCKPRDCSPFATEKQLVLSSNHHIMAWHFFANARPSANLRISAWRCSSKQRSQAHSRFSLTPHSSTCVTASQHRRSHKSLSIVAPPLGVELSRNGRATEWRSSGPNQFTLRRKPAWRC